MSYEIASGNYRLRTEQTDEGIGIGFYKMSTASGVCQYRSPRPAIIDLRDYCAVNIEIERPYEKAEANEKGILCTADVKTEAGSIFRITDQYEALDDKGSFTIDRNVEIIKAAEDDVGFCSRVTVRLLDSQDFLDYDYLAPGVWYKHNDFIPAHRIFSDKTLDYYWYKETRYTLPFFMMQSKKEGRVVTLAHLEPDLDTGVYEPTAGWVEWLNSPTIKYGSIGCHKKGGMAIDYLYPGSEGAENVVTRMHGRSDNVDISWLRRSNPVELGFTQHYKLCLHMAEEYDYYKAMTDTWRYFYDIIACDQVECDNELVYKTGIEILNRYTREYNGVMGLPFLVNLPNGEVDRVSYQIGFVGMQTGCAYQLMRYGHDNSMPELIDKGRAIIEFWTHESMTDWGLPKTWYDVNPPVFHDCVIHMRLIADGLEGVLDAYKFMKSIGENHPDWLQYCVTVGNWLVRNQNADGSWYRTYDWDGNPILKTPYNTTNPLRFLANLYVETGDEKYKEAMRKAGEFCYEAVYKGFNYSGAVFDGPNTTDKEAALYAIFGFIALYDVFKDERYLEAAVAAANYTETWTYAYEYPVYCIEKSDPLARDDCGISGLSPVSAGGGGGDVFMAEMPFAYYRLYLYTGDEHLLEFAKFLNKNTRQTYNWKGNFDYKYPGLVAEGTPGFMLMSGVRGCYYWLPWCTQIVVDPILRMRDTFGAYEIEEIEKLPLEKRKELNETVGLYK